jgi:eukaryotic-like serine/threonine-protein kinase
MNQSSDKGSVTPERISHYRIIERLGAGGMGVVYLAEDTRLGRKVALKVLPSELSEDEHAKKRLLREAQAAANLDHPNICSIHEVGEDGLVAFIVMQYIEGETLATRINRGPIELREVLSLAVQIADALVEAHSRNIIHRDIKPQNIMITTRGQVKVLDFGLAKLVSEEKGQQSWIETKSMLTQPGAMVGTVPYMSPEQLRGIEVDVRSDIFSFGAVLYEMVSGRCPFDAQSGADTISAILTKEPLALTRYLPKIPPELSWIVSKALHKEKEERYQTARELLTDLRGLSRRLEFEAEVERSYEPSLSSGVSATTGASAAERGAATAARVERKTSAITRGLIDGLKRHGKEAIVAVLAVVATVAAISYFAGRGDAIDSLAILPLENASGDPNTEYLSDGISESLINSLSKLSNLKVIARSSSFRYKGKDVDPQAVGRALGVRAILTGRIIQRGDNILISVDLEDVKENRHLWGEQYNQRVSDVLAVQEGISKEISEKLRIRLTNKEQEELARRGTENVQSYQLYLKGRFYSGTWTQEGMNQAIENYNEAIRVDPNNALAYVGQAEVYYLFSSQFSSPKDTMPKVSEAASKALEKDPTLAEAHTYTGIVSAFYEHQFSRADREFQLAIQLNPGSASAHQWYGYFLIASRQWDKALTELNRAQELDPLSGTISSMLGMRLFSMREYDKAIDQLTKAIRLDSEFWWSHFFLGWVYELKGMPDKGMEELNTAVRLGGSSWVSAYIGFVKARAGETADARKVLAELEEQSKHRYISPHHFAIVYVGLGEKDQALDWLYKAYDLGEDAMAFLEVDPTWDSLRSDPRFKELLRRVGLPDN